ncbi:MAG: TauD/TfdA family dioxygenase [Steroidobacteraceae bacterium]
MTNDTVIASTSTLITSLGQRGWATYVAASGDAGSVATDLAQIGDILGTRVMGRAGALEEMIEPRDPDDAHPRSLSAQYGLRALPFHVELSHRPRPCRYLLLGCIDPGSPSAVTMLLDWQNLGFSPEELHLLESAPIFVRTGRRSFYSTILSGDHGYLRYDPGCLEAVDERGRAALGLLQHRLAGSSPDNHEWRRGDILIIDNWRVLHGRAPSGYGSGRRLARILIDA